MNKRSLSALLLLAYGFLLFQLMVLKDVPLIRIGSLMLNFGGTQVGPPNLVPFKTIGPYLLGEKGLMIAGINLFGNIVLLVPVGILIPLVFRGVSWNRTILLAVAAGAFIEGMQVVLHVGIFDIDDVILNGLGVIAGYGMYVLFLKNRQKLQPAIIIASFLFVVSAIAFSGVYFYRNHRFPISFEPAVSNSLPDHREDGRAKGDSCCDLCNGTGGTGQIIGIGQHSITIERRDGVVQEIKLTDKTMIKTSAGPASETDLKVGNRVTLIIPESDDGSMTAAAVLVCMEPKPETMK